jgi:hypothetical protein
MKEADAYIKVFFMSALVGGERIASGSGRFPRRQHYSKISAKQFLCLIN